MDLLVIWNCAHIANATHARALALVCREGYGFDVKAILAASKKRQDRSTRKTVSLVPKKKLNA